MCYIKIHERNGEHVLTFRPAIEYNDSLVAFRIKEQIDQILVDNIHYCRACGRCAPGKDVVFFGKKIKHKCHGIDFEFVDPDVKTLECARKLVVYRRSEIANRMEN